MRSHSQVPGLGCEHIFLEHIIQATTNNVPDIFLWPSVYTPPFSAILSAPGSWPIGYHDLWLPAGFCKWEAPGGIGGTEKSEAREFIYLVPFCEEPRFAVCLDKKVTCSTWLCLIPGFSKLFLFFLGPGVGIDWLPLAPAIYLTVSFVISPFINKPSRTTLICAISFFLGPCHLSTILWASVLLNKWF